MATLNLQTKAFIAMAKWRQSKDGEKTQNVGTTQTIRRFPVQTEHNAESLPFSVQDIDVSQIELDKNSLPKPRGLSKFFSGVRELALSGGGGAGRAYPAAFVEAARFGLDFEKLEVICATSVGSIVGLGIVIGAPPKDFKKILDNMPTDKFQDWSLSSILSVFKTWGLCEGKIMPSCFRQIIKEYTGLDDPSFDELYAATGKEFRVIVANASRKKMQILSHKITPKMSVAEAVGISCSVPILFPPKMIPNSDGELEYYIDGGILKNYPWGVGSPPSRKIEEQLGFIFVNSTAAYALNNDGNNGVFNFLDFLYNLFTLIVFQDPLCLPDAVQARTIAIELALNAFTFTPTEEVQKQMNVAAKRSVRRSVKQVIQTQHDYRLDALIPPCSTPLFQYQHSQVLGRQSCANEPNISDVSEGKAQGYTHLHYRFLARQISP